MITFFFAGSLGPAAAREEAQETRFRKQPIHIPLQSIHRGSGSLCRTSRSRPAPLPRHTLGDLPGSPLQRAVVPGEYSHYSNIVMGYETITSYKRKT